jgi:hypothetical protein
VKYHVKLNCWDWPRRGDRSVMKLTVDADGDMEAMQTAMMEAQQARSGAKMKVFDCERDRIEKFESAQTIVSRETPPEVPNISSAMKRGRYEKISP